MKLKLFILTLMSVSVFTTLTPVTVQAVGGACRTTYVAGAKRELQNMSQLRLMTYNVENLFMHVGKFERTSAVDMERKTNSHDKPENEIRAIGQVITEENPDIVVLQEVESLDALQALDERYLANGYKPMLIEGNDTRGINIGFLVKGDLNLQTKIETHKDIRWTDPIDHKEIALFSRDLPALLVSKVGSEQPLLIVLGNHAKSKRNRPGDPESQIIRTAQYQGIADIVRQYQQRYGDKVPVVLTGDFNTDVQHAPELKPLQGVLSDSFDLLAQPVSDHDRVTHTFHPESGPTISDQMDSVMVNSALSKAVKEAHVYRYKDANGNVKPLPQTYDEREQNPSDHFPVIVDLSVDPMLSIAH